MAPLLFLVDLPIGHPRISSTHIENNYVLFMVGVGGRVKVVLRISNAYCVRLVPRADHCDLFSNFNS